MAYRMVYLRIRSGGYSFGWTSGTEQAAFKEETRRIFQESGWTLKPGSNGVCDTVTSGHQDLYLHPLSFSGVMDEANIQTLQEQLSKAKTFQCYHLDCYEEYLDMSDEEYHAALEAKRGEITDYILEQAEQNDPTCILQTRSRIVWHSSLRSAVSVTGTGITA